VIRPARQGDEEALARINRAAWALADDPPPIERLRDAFAERLGQQDRTLFVAEENGELRGFVSYGDGEIHALYVHPDVQGRGIGRALLEKALEELKRRSHEEATLWSLAVNDRATAFYEANGFARDGAARANEIRFRRKL
jgi:ribosomal protein S18 acetylase RimI-like enzyme